MKKRRSAGGGELPLWKRVLYGLFTTVFFLLVIEAGLWLLGLGTERGDPFVGFSGGSSLFVEQSTPAGRSWMVTAPEKREHFNIQRFPREKATGSRRIFCVGGSTTYGRPYDASLSFCGWLQAFLESEQPERRWEVINAGGISYASYRIVVLMEELARYDPDYFIIYSGHNEFLERRSYPALSSLPPPALDLAAVVSRTHLFRATKRALEHLSSDDLSSDDNSPPAGRLLLPSEVDEILNHSIGPSAYHRDDAFRSSALMHYRHNLEQMAEIARKAGAGAIFVMPAANLKDCAPFKSEHGPNLANAELDRWRQQYDAGIESQAGARHAEAARFFEAARAIDGQHAELHYRLAMSLLALDRVVEARAAFQQALNLDVAPLRAPEDFQLAMREVALGNALPLIDYPRILGERAREELGYPISGSEAFLDHVHPSFEATRTLALALLEELVAEGALADSLIPDPQQISEVSAKKRAELTPERQGRAYYNLGSVLNWAGKSDQAYELFQRSRALLGDLPEVLMALGNAAERTGRLEEALRIFVHAIAVSPDSAELVLTAMEARRRLHGDRDELSFLRQLVDLAPSNHMARNYYGVALAEEDQLEPAILQFRHALAIEPTFPAASYHLGMALSDAGRFAEALPHLEVAVEADPENGLAHNNLGVALAQTQQWARSLSRFEEAMRIDPDLPAPQRNAEAVRERMRALDR